MKKILALLAFVALAAPQQSCGPEPTLDEPPTDPTIVEVPFEPVETT